MESSREWIHREDLTCLTVPWRLWGLDEIPEWLQRGWPNPMPDRQGKVGEPSTWQFNTAWDVHAMKSAEAHQRLPTSLEHCKDKHLIKKKWYKAFLETGDDLILPWAE